MLRWVLGGLAGSAVGVAIWVGIGMAGYEIGWIAWGIGFLVGLGVRYGAYLGDHDEDTLQGVVAAVMACGSILVAKYILFHMLVVGPIDDAIQERQANTTSELMIALQADTVVEEMTEQGKTVNWPAGMTYDEARSEPDYPPAVWKQAEARWSKLSPAEQQQKIDEQIAAAEALFRRMAPSFASFFSPWDLLWFGLAMITAFRIGVGSYGED